MGADPVTIGVKVALTAASMALTATQKIEGPRLDSLDVTTADYGTPLDYFWGIKRLEGSPIIWAEKLRENKSTSKTKGGKYSEYKYFGTFAVAIADHEIDTVSRIWMDKHLVYDVTRAGPISPLAGFFSGLQGSPVKITNGKNMRIYLGTETQEPDPRMEAWCEDRYGADSCPAYRGVAYIVWEEIPLEKFGNRIPQVTVEAVNNSNHNYLWETHALTSDTEAGQFSPDYSRFYADSSVWDTATRTRMYTVPTRPNALGVGGHYYRLAPGTLELYGSDGTTMVEVARPTTADTVAVFPDSFGRNLIFLGSAIGTTYQHLNGAVLDVFDIDFHAVAWAQDGDGNVWTAGNYGSGAHGVRVVCTSGPRIGDDYTLATASNDYPHIWFTSADEFVIEQAGNLYRLDASFVTLQTATITGTGTMSSAPRSDRMWRVTTTAAIEYSLTDFSLIRSLSSSSWVGAGSVAGGTYEPITHAIVAANGNVLRWFYLDRVGSDGTLLADVVSDVATRCRVVEYDVSDLSQTVAGYSTTRGAGKDWIAPLLEIHDVDARPHDFAVQFLTRGDSAAGTIAVADFVRDDPRYKLPIKLDTDLPRRLSLSFADSDKDQQKNTVISQRPLDGTDGDGELTIDLTTYVATPGEAQKFSDRYFRRKWIGRTGVTAALTPQYLALEPGDVWNLQLDDVTQTHRLVKSTLSQGRIETEWERDFPSLATLGTGAGAVMDGRDDDVIYVPSPTKGFVLDIPLTADADDLSVPQVHYAAGNYGSGDWPGATIYKSDPDADEYAVWNGIDAADKAGWGYSTDTLGDADPWCWDRGNSVNITYNGTLTSSTEAAINGDPTINMAVIGTQGAYEVINFVTATLESDGSYTLSGFKRGRRGTEWATGLHTTGDEFILVASLDRDGFGLSDVGSTMDFKAQTVGRDPAESMVIEVDFSGATLKPYAPAKLKLVFDGTDLDGTITRRDRLGGGGFLTTTIPQSETTEAYEVDVYNGATFKRTISVSGTNTFSYTAAMAASDGIALPTPPTFYVYQISAAVGRGFALAA